MKDLQKALAMLLLTATVLSASACTETPQAPDTEGSASVSTETETVEESTDDTEESELQKLDPAPVPASEGTAVIAGVTPVAPIDYYGRVWLSEQKNGEALTRAYDRILQAVAGMEASVALNDAEYPLTKNQAEKVLLCVFGDSPQYFWWEGSYQIQMGKKKVLSASFTYSISKEEKAGAEARFNQTVTELMQGISSTMGDYEKEIRLYNNLILHQPLGGGSTSDKRSAYVITEEKFGTPHGFARAFQHLCRSAGLQAVYGEGILNKPQIGKLETGWNYVKINGDYYLVDLTMDAPAALEEYALYYSSFNLADTTASAHYTLSWNGYPVPKCPQTKENYYTKNNAVLQKNATAQELSRLAEDKGGYVSYRFRFRGTSEELETWYESIRYDLYFTEGARGKPKMNALFYGDDCAVIVLDYEGILN